jgi:hypothetical protein
VEALQLAVSRPRDAKPDWFPDSSPTLQQGNPVADLYYPGTSWYIANSSGWAKVTKLTVVCSLLLLSSFVGCSATEQDSTASVQQAVERHLSARTDLDPGNLTVTVENVNFEGDRATAAVTIQARKDPQAKMQMTYHLRKAGDGWEVEPQASGAGAHGGGMTAPETAPMPETGESASELPPGHPPVGGASGSQPSELPPGHPPVSGQSPKASTQ